MSTRTRILEATAELLASSPSGEVSTRAICQAAGVGQPVLYRQFGDKAGLLAAVVDYGFEQYLEAKRARVPSEDPVGDLRDGWDGHIEFALAHKSFYRLMYSTSATSSPTAGAEAFRLLERTLERCAAAGRLRVPPVVAARMVMSANVGVALMLITRPENFDDPELSHRVRDAVHARILSGPAPVLSAVAPVAAHLNALLADSSTTALTEAETALLRDWLTRLSR
ncbi:TetR/AcrR family transcriptional regulator [Allokutzneria sp. A3M-2-11 16]|uniref:TetR/AcrR family transcriptional regulator n=1 Tax=Allokutzneria sp. A3M-2-11 16 TaxID=2962043 RepID=UPI0020B6AA3A|nr:TetR/AcrR family transcriptional regulator [Allokutzneria sp. A3M-2-11 16]MCP3803567.1 TetR/AcrR family transcriptional regulator [Allokutzneria sp. A3M-2-11 16]